jgi:hypothetical protein
MPTIDPKDLMGRTFLKDSEADGQRLLPWIVRVVDHDADMKQEPHRVKFLCEVNGDTADEIYTYNPVLDFMERDNLDLESDTEQLYHFWRISPRAALHIRCRAKLWSYRNDPFWNLVFLFLVRITKQSRLIRLMVIVCFKTQKPRRLSNLGSTTPSLTRVKVVYLRVGTRRLSATWSMTSNMMDVKHDGRHNSRLVAGGHLTDPNTDSVYSSAVFLRGIQLVTFLSKLNRLKSWGTNVGNAYLEATTKERVYIV